MRKRSIKTVGLVINRHRPEASEIARKLSIWLRGRRITVLSEAEAADQIGAIPLSKGELAARADLIVVLGGDGTLLSIARFIGSRETPILGINLGGLGFLTQATMEEAHESVARAVGGDFEVDRRITLRAEVRGAGRKKQTQMFQALNDVVIVKRVMGRMLEMEVLANRQKFCSYRADGLIIATPTGSTGYALSAGGPIVFPTVDAILLAPICPHTLSNRPVVLPDTFNLEIRIKSGEDHDATLTLDGQEGMALGLDQLIRVGKSSHPVALIKSSHSYFEIWRQKLRWG